MEASQGQYAPPAFSPSIPHTVGSKNEGRLGSNNPVDVWAVGDRLLGRVVVVVMVEIVVVAVAMVVVVVVVVEQY